MQQIPDHNARQQALDTKSSFIVQAPAGSGKTALLVNRYLALLATCQQPEDILAITFTRKAAQEMHLRVHEALHLAQQPRPKTDHQLQVWTLARAVLERNQVLNWHLEDTPHRLRILTIDGLCAHIAQQLPITATLSPTANVVSDPTHLYRQATDRLLQQLTPEKPWHNGLSTLLEHLQGQEVKVRNLLVHMLACRDQWLPYFFDPNIKSNPQTYLANSLQHWIANELEATHTQCSANTIATLQELMVYAARNINDTTVNHELSPNIEQLHAWQCLSELCLTKAGQWRKSVSKAQGFPAASTLPKAEQAEAKQMKALMMRTLTDLQARPAILAHLQFIQQCPPGLYNEDEWYMLSALSEVLPLLAAELSLLLQQNNTADYVEISLKALQALNNTEQTTTQAQLHERISHILVDEFQDTSASQFRLLQTLTQHWEPEDQKTIFVVGDPMQSIYRFRQADVSLFTLLQEHGINNISLIPLTLKCNFRSKPYLIDWVNTQCQLAFPQQPSKQLGAITFSNATSPVPSQLYTDQDMHQCHVTASETASSVLICQLIQQHWQRRPDTSIAILARSRSHLGKIIPALKNQQIPFVANDIHPLSNHVIVHDLLTLTRCCHQLLDRTAWLAVLRAPWCGLTLNDLLVIAERSLDNTVWRQINHSETQQQLSLDGQRRLLRVVPALNHLVEEAQRQPMAELIRDTWQNLGGVDCYHHSDREKIFLKFIAHLTQFTEEHAAFHPEHFTETCQSLYATNDSTASNPVQIMTIHKAKGLEFDCVIIPECQRCGQADQKAMLLWHQHWQHNQQHLILASLPHHKSTHNSCYSLCEYIKKNQQHNELIRLLYVALTRAKSSIHCIASCSDLEKTPTRNSFQNLLSSAFSKAAMHHTDNPTIDDKKKPLMLSRLREDWQHPHPPQYSTQPHNNGNRYQEPEENTPEATLGIIVHRILWRLSHLKTLPSATADWINQQTPYWQQLLHLHRVDATEHHTFIQRITPIILQTLSDPRGRWILHQHHDAQSEYRIQQYQPEMREFIIDRTFIADQTRWIIDYKCSPCDTDIDGFLKEKRQQHHAQLTQYGLLMHQLDPTHPIKLGLYFPSFGGWTAWDHQPSQQPQLLNE